MAVAKIDENSRASLIAVSNVDATTIVPLYADPVTHRLLVDIAGGSGTVTSVSVVSANGFAGSVATATTTPAITLSTTITGILQGNGTAISAITVGSGLSFVAGTLSATGGSGITIGTTTITSGTDTRILYNNAGVVGEYTLTGTGTAVVMANTPTLITPVLGVATATSVNKITLTAPASGATLTIVDGKTLTQSNTLTYSGTDGSSVNFGTGGTVLYSTSTIPLTVGTTTIASGTTTRILYDNAGVLGEYTLTGSGTVVAMQTAPTFITSITAPLVIGGSGTTGTQLTLKTTTGNGTTDALVIVGGNNGATTFATFTSGALTIGTSGAFTTGTIELGAASDTTLARVSAGVISVEGVTVATSSNTLSFTNKSVGAGTLVLEENASIALDPALSADGKYSGTTISGTAGATLAFGDLVYLAAADSRWELADADAASTSGDVMLGFCVLAAASDGDPTVILLDGNIRADAAFPALTISAQAYVSTTAGDIQVAQPSGTDDVIRVVGFALTADSLLVKISPDYITHT